MFGSGGQPSAERTLLYHVWWPSSGGMEFDRLPPNGLAFSCCERAASHRFKKATISRAKRSTATPCSVAGRRRSGATRIRRPPPHGTTRHDGRWAEPPQHRITPSTTGHQHHARAYHASTTRTGTTGHGTTGVQESRPTHTTKTDCRPRCPSGRTWNETNPLLSTRRPSALGIDRVSPRRSSGRSRGRL